MIDCHEPTWFRILKIPIMIILLPYLLIYFLILKDKDCSICGKKIWRLQKSVRLEKPFIASDGNNYPSIYLYHLKCYKEKIE